MSYKLTNKQRHDIKKRGLRGESTAKLALEFGVNVTTICYHIANARVDNARPAPRNPIKS